MTSIEEDRPSVVAADIEGVLSGNSGMFAEFVSAVVKECVRSGAKMIGHVKANVRSGKELMSLSSTTDDGNVRIRDPLKHVERYSMTINVIVYGVDEGAISKILVSQRKMLGNNRITIFSDTGCMDPECNDPECTDGSHRIIRPF